MPSNKCSKPTWEQLGYIFRLEPTYRRRYWKPRHLAFLYSWLTAWICISIQNAVIALVASGSTDCAITVFILIGVISAASNFRDCVDAGNRVLELERRQQSRWCRSLATRRRSADRHARRTLLVVLCQLANHVCNRQDNRHYVYNSPAVIRGRHHWRTIGRLTRQLFIGRQRVSQAKNMSLGLL